MVTAPTGQFSAMTLENFSRRSTTWFHPRFSLSRESSPAQVRRVLDAVSNVIASDPKVEPGTFWVRFAAVGQYSLDFDISAYILTSNDDEFGRIQQELLLRILEAVEATGSRLALPTQASINYTADSDAGLARRVVRLPSASRPCVARLSHPASPLAAFLVRLAVVLHAARSLSWRAGVLALISG